jgi:hypothetical protein
MANSKKPKNTEAAEETTLPEEQAGSVIDEIAEDLAESGTEEAQGKDGPQAKTVQSIDWSKLSLEDLQALRERLEATPAKQAKKGNSTITLRRIDGKFVVKIGRARAKMVHDDLLDKKVEKFSLPVFFLNEEAPVEMDYKEFMQSERVTCEVLSISTNKREVVEGQVFSRELGHEVEQITTYVDQVFKVKLPDGEILELEADSVNL